MNNSTDLNNNDKLGDEIDIKSLFKTILNGKLLIIVCTGLFAIIALIYSLSLSNIYQSTALLSPVGEQSSSSNSLNNIGGLASLAGISISSSSGGNSGKAITKITTLSFFKENRINCLYEKIDSHSFPYCFPIIFEKVNDLKQMLQHDGIETEISVNPPFDDKRYVVFDNCNKKNSDFSVGINESVYIAIPSLLIIVWLDTAMSNGVLLKLAYIF